MAKKLAGSPPCIVGCQCRRHKSHPDRNQPCPPGCACGKHKPNDGHQQVPPPRNVTAILTNPAERLQSTWGDEQRARVQRATDERHAKGIVWRGNPSENFDWDRALEHMRKCLAGNP